MWHHLIHFLLMRLSSKTVSINEILEGKNVWHNLKIEQKVSLKLLIEFEVSYFNNSI